MNTTTNTESTIHQIPAAADLDAWSQREWDDGVQIDRLPDLETLAVKTMNSTYEITIVSGHSGDVLVRGGQFFPEKTPAHLAGATFGGSFLKLRGIYLGMRMEFLHEGCRIVTSPVRSIGIAM
jgi:hypothetical protein